MSWLWNGDYKDLEQVAEFLPDFERRLAELTAANQNRFNDSFKGHIPGIAGRNEDTGIYLLQGLERHRREQQKIAALLADGYEPVQITARTATLRYEHIVLYSQPGAMDGGWQEHYQARLLIRYGMPHAVLPKRKRTTGYLVNGRNILVKAATTDRASVTESE